MLDPVYILTTSTGVIEMRPIMLVDFIDLTKLSDDSDELEAWWESGEADHLVVDNDEHAYLLYTPETVLQYIDQETYPVLYETVQQLPPNTYISLDADA